MPPLPANGDEAKCRPNSSAGQATGWAVWLAGSLGRPSDVQTTTTADLRDSMIRMRPCLKSRKTTLAAICKAALVVAIIVMLWTHDNPEGLIKTLVGVSPRR